VTKALEAEQWLILLPAIKVAHVRPWSLGLQCGGAFHILMTDPISSFSKLSLSHTPMQSSRGQGREQLPGTGEGPAFPDDDPSHSEDEEEEIPFVDRIFALDHCRPHGMPEDGRPPSSPRFAFQIAEAQVKRYGVRISAANPRSITCSCDEAGVCRHGRWLLKQLDRTGLQSGGTDTNLFRYIEQKGLESVCDTLTWEIRGQPTNSESDLDSDDPDEPGEQKWELKKKLPTSQISRHTRGPLKERCDTVRDIMATLCSEPTEDYRPDIFDAEDDITLRPIALCGDVGGTFSRWLLQDDESFLRVKPLVPHDMRASAYFKSMALKAHNACEFMDRYAQLGPSPGAIVHHDVVWCAQTLVDVVNSVGRNISRRQPLSHSSRREASSTLVSILQEVVDRNKDVYQDDRLPRRRPHGEPQTNRNLYERLIGSNSATNPAGPMFILRDLQDLPEAQPFVEILEETLGKLQTIGWGPAPLTYREKLRAIITQLKGSSESIMPLAGPSSSTGGKRRASLMDRKNKRMK
jgi:hypothetical protein